MKNIHEFLHRFQNPDMAIVLVRIALGVVFINAGLLKIQNIDLVVQGFASMGISAFLAYFVSYAEFIGGILMVLGIFTRYTAVILATIMVVAIAKVHFVNGFSVAKGGYEYTLVLFLISISMLMTGAGKYSLTNFIKSKKIENTISS